jgi:SagB-type dehydrogenase family enzyme
MDFHGAGVFWQECWRNNPMQRIMSRMTQRILISIFLLLALAATAMAVSPALPTADTKAAQEVALPKPVLTGGIPLNEALATRRSVRLFTAEKVTLAEIGQLLWSAQGVTSANGQRTAPSAHAQYYLHVYVAQADGFYEYLPAKHALVLLTAKDLRGVLSTQETVKKAPVVFLVAGEYERAAKNTDHATAERLVNLEAGHATQNILLAASGLKLGAVPVGGIVPADTAKAAGLPAGITPIYLVPVGHPQP